jgi:hypothetical protein
VGKFAASRFLASCGRKARKAQAIIQAQSTPRSVQAKIISVGGMASGTFMGTTSFLDIHTVFSGLKIAGTTISPLHF